MTRGGGFDMFGVEGSKVGSFDNVIHRVQALQRPAANWRS